jgi:DNA-binding MarR family transcriptional regulator
MSALVALEHGGQMEFIYLRNLLKATDGNLGAHLEKLEGAGYIRIEKTFVAKKPRTFISVSDKGRDAFTQHIAALKLIIKTSKGL